MLLQVARWRMSKAEPEVTFTFKLLYPPLGTRKKACGRETVFFLSGSLVAVKLCLFRTGKVVERVTKRETKDKNVVDAIC